MQTPNAIAPFSSASWESCLSYFRKRGGVIFLSDSRFWESHGFVQQSLAYRLAAAGVQVTWLDGLGWRTYHPVIENPQPSLTVRQIWLPPLQRLGPIRSVALRLVAADVRRLVRAHGGDPVLWVEDGLGEEVAAMLPYVDV